MALFTALVAAAVVGSTVMQVNQQKKAERNARAEARKQEIKAENAAKLKGTKEQDVRVKIGDGGGDALQTSSNKKGDSTANSGVDKRVGRILPDAGTNVGGL